MSVINQTQNTVIAREVVVADTSWARMVGLLNRASLGSDEALVITQCRSIHMFFMRFAIDVIFADRSHRVVGLAENIKPFGLSKIFWNANYCIELPAGTVGKTKTKIGDQLSSPF